MVKTLQKKFIATAMTAITLLLSLLLGGINIANALFSDHQAAILLDELAKAETAPIMQPPHIGMHKFDVFRPEITENSKMSAIYFVVRADSSGQIIHTELSRIASIDEEDARSIAVHVLSSGHSSGTYESFRYKTVLSPAGDTTIIFLDSSSQLHSVLRVAAFSLLAGLICWILMLILVMLLSRRAIRPIAENIEKQRRFVTDAGHELKTPLAIILANTEALELRSGETKYSRNIRSQVNRLSGLTQNLLTLARADEAVPPAGLEELSLTELAEESVQMFRELAATRNIELNLELQEEVSVFADRGHISQLFSILVDNAIKYSPADSSVAVRLSKEDKAIFSVENRVLSTEVPVHRMFDRFYRADESRTQSRGGYGIGLSAAKAIAQIYKGSIHAEYNDDRIIFTVKL